MGLQRAPTRLHCDPVVYLSRMRKICHEGQHHDEVFRVFGHEHPEVRFEYINANENVGFMIQRGLLKET